MLSRISMNDFLSIINQINIIDPEMYLDKNKKYYIYCQKGLSSFNVVSILNKLGYNLISVDGGYENWIMMK